MNLKETIAAYVPRGEQELGDRQVMLDCFETFDDLLTRENAVAHFTASAWICDPARERVLMIYHNIYDSWAWTGGHADGEEDLLSVALREAREETGLERVRAISNQPISLEILPVSPHVKRGRFVSSHLHFNLTYLLEADPDAVTKVRPDENSGVKWFGREEAVAASSESDMRVIYRKLNARMLEMK